MGDAPAPSSLDVVIVNYRQWEETVRLVRQLRLNSAETSGRVSILIVDNHSPPHPAAAELAALDDVRLCRWTRNRGFAAAVNEGGRLGRGTWLLLLNPDVSVPVGFLDAVLALTDELDQREPRTGIVGLGLRDTDGGVQGSTGPFPTFFSILTDLLRPRAWRKYRPVGLGQRRAAAWVTGCGLLVRRACLEAVGGFDRRFFLYYEDVDLCRRARRRGWRVVHEPRLVLTHHQPTHRRRVSPALHLATRHALLTYAAGHWPRWQLHVLAQGVRLEAWLRRRWSGQNGSDRGVGCWRLLGELARAIAAGHETSAREALEQALQAGDVRGG
ncbi:MAG: glycosyltransferase [Gemmataceae bacterium]|nr:glycosyltransferase [Gemmataceae bacterium]